MAHFGIIRAAGFGDIWMLKLIRDKIGDEGKFRRMCDSVCESLGFKALHAAAGMDEFDTCKFLVEEVGVDLDVKAHKGDTPLLIAIKGGYAVIAEYLIERGADVTITDSKGFTALHCAIPHEDMEIMALLLMKGADIEADSVGGTPLHCAASLGSVDIVNFLLKNKAKPNSVAKYFGISPLVAAIYSTTNTLECVELLLKAKADPNKVSNGLSPLAHAVEANSNSCIDSLLASGADVDGVSSCGLKPIEHAALVDNVESIWILIQARPRILATPDWSFRNLMNSINSVEAKQRRYLYGRYLKQNGDDAWDKQDYASAIASYTEAIHHNPHDVDLVANRSLCWSRMGESLFALQDAEACVGLEPDWDKGHVREGIAWNLLEGYNMSSDAFKMAYEVDSDNEEIER